MDLVHEPDGHRVGEVLRRLPLRHCRAVVKAAPGKQKQPDGSRGSIAYTSRRTVLYTYAFSAAL